MSILGFHHVAVQVRDVARVAAFYRERLGLPELRRFTQPDGSLRSVWVGLSGDQRPEAPFLAVEAAQQDGPRGELGFSMVALRIAPEQRRPLVASLAAAGVPVERETGWTFYVRDPEGNLVGLSHHPYDPA